MATPRVFVSSTCYDLASERDSLLDFCNSFGFDAALSERGDVFFHPDLHTHQSCVNEVGNCHLLVLIIGGRFGGRYRVDPAKSITNAEYAAAREAGMPIFTFIKQDVLQDHNVWQNNKAQEFVSRIHYPSIDKQEHAIDIFKFIDDVRLSKSNNSYFSFSLPREIHETLRKQWAAMFLDALKHRNIDKQMSLTNETLAKLTSASQKLEELAKSIYKNVDRENAERSISEIDLTAEAKEMFHLIASRLGDGQFIPAYDVDEVCDELPGEWWEFLLQTVYFDEVAKKQANGKVRRYLSYLDGHTLLPIDRGVRKRENSDIDALEASYSAFLSLDASSRKQVCAEFAYASTAFAEATEEQEAEDDL